MLVEQPAPCSAMGGFVYLREVGRENTTHMSRRSWKFLLAPPSVNPGAARRGRAFNTPGQPITPAVNTLLGFLPWSSRAGLQAMQI